MVSSSPQAVSVFLFVLLIDRRNHIGIRRYFVARVKYERLQYIFLFTVNMVVIEM